MMSRLLPALSSQPRCLAQPAVPRTHLSLLFLPDAHELVTGGAVIERLPLPAPPLWPCSNARNRTAISICPARRRSF